MKPISELDPEAVTVVYFRADSTDTNLGALEVSWDDGVTWDELTAATDPDAQPAYQLTLIGPNVSSPPAGHVLSAQRQNKGLIRLVDNPEITVKRFRIDVRSR